MQESEGVIRDAIIYINPYGKMGIAVKILQDSDGAILGLKIVKVCNINRFLTSFTV